jgi:transcriptional regulator with XRE-family HTH domain
MAERKKPKDPLDHDPESVTWARVRRGLTKRELAGNLGVAPSLITEIEKGTRNATPPMILRLANELGVPTDELLRKSLRRPSPAVEAKAA